MASGQVFRDLHEFHACYPQSASFQAADDRANQAALYAVRLDDDQCSFHKTSYDYWHAKGGLCQFQKGRSPP
jgi:hypothetical protein